MGTKLALIFERDDFIYKFDMCCLFTVMTRLNLATRNMIKKRKFGVDVLDRYVCQHEITDLFFSVPDHDKEELVRGIINDA
jgi:hypothetical protein